MKILYVENHDGFSRIVTRQFLSDHDVVIIPTMSEARKLIRADRFDLVIMDYDLDDGKGADFVAELAAENPRPKIIASSSREDGNEFLLEAGADAVCGKIDFDEIGATIEKLFAEQES